MKVSTSHYPLFTGERGYTLIEVLIASSIFVVVLIIGTATFSTANRLRERTLAITLTTETARSITESISRDLRAATGIRETDGSFACEDLVPFGLGTAKDSTTDLVTGATLQTVRFDGSVGTEGETVIRNYFVDETQPDTPVLKVQTRTFQGAPDCPLRSPTEDTTTSLLPGELVLAENGFIVSGLTHELSPGGVLPTGQPFAQLKLALRYTGDPRNDDVGLATQTSVTSREYLE